MKCVQWRFFYFFGHIQSKTLRGKVYDLKAKLGLRSKNRITVKSQERLVVGKGDDETHMSCSRHTRFVETAQWPREIPGHCVNDWDFILIQ